MQSMFLMEAQIRPTAESASSSETSQIKWSRHH